MSTVDKGMGSLLRGHRVGGPSAQYQEAPLAVQPAQYPHAPLAVLRRPTTAPVVIPAA
jgi:hypothetical protein